MRGDGDDEHVAKPSAATQVMLVALATGCDQTINYPMWILAKRIGAGLGWPRVGDLYKGCAALYLTYFPTVAVEDASTRVLTDSLTRLAPSLGDQGREVLAAACGGVAAGVLVANPTENIVVKAHARDTGVADACRYIWQKGGLRGMLCPYGSTAMMLREAPFSAGLFYLRDRMATFFHGQSTNSALAGGSKSRTRWWAEEFAGSIACAAIVNVASHPASVVLAMQQAYDITTREALRRLWSEGGLRSFYRGYLPRSATLGGTMFTVPTMMSLGASHLGRWEHLPFASAAHDQIAEPFGTWVPGSHSGVLTFAHAAHVGWA
mmetsp:Transcript_33019/g.77179  ORF Transcript_33019/g.77179 Transcript_33019/m.77179 type:complete len:321 (+) Transcript_33019:187-1149(+)|eukprot:CAMPEP_0178413496 /NCGR_PEP_ID=MMETSP0689_2-20121128/22556_1 /TAXON_ID=160604 /ORGANISM="Amphidinium massartii, Strain CS-259" /LENGTH=320 /DNA_ID=CAMNT_0020034767 /DNA_START=96 /DNA_END=1058 /DNA_ORIENTATION=+